MKSQSPSRVGRWENWLRGACGRSLGENGSRDPPETRTSASTGTIGAGAAEKDGSGHREERFGEKIAAGDREDRFAPVPDFLCTAWPQFPHESRSLNGLCPSPRPFLRLSLTSAAVCRVELLSLPLLCLRHSPLPHSPRWGPDSYSPD